MRWKPRAKFPWISSVTSFLNLPSFAFKSVCYILHVQESLQLLIYICMMAILEVYFSVTFEAKISSEHLIQNHMYISPFGVVMYSGLR